MFVAAEKVELGGCGPVHVELEQVERTIVAIESEEVVGRASGWLGWSIDVRRQDASRSGGEALLGGSGAGQHLGTIVGAGLGAGKVTGRVKEVEGGVVGVGPDADLGVVVEVALRKGVAVVGAGRVRGLGDGDALFEGGGGSVGVGDGELGDDPAGGDLVIEGAWIAVVVCFAQAAEAGKHLVVGHGSVQKLCQFCRRRRSRC